MKKRYYSKMLSVFSLAIAIVTLLWFIPLATFCYADGGYGYGTGGGIIGGTSYPGFTSFTGKITGGVLAYDITAKSPDNLCQLTINEGTKALDKTGGSLTGIIITEMKQPPAPPADSSIIGLTYDFGPEGANFFDPDTGEPKNVTITFTYDPAKIPAGASPIIAYYDKVTSTWVPLEDIKVGPGNIISGKINHFTAFTVLVYTRPATFVTSALSISPSEVEVGESVTISVRVANTGVLIGSYEVTLKINNIVIATESVTLAGGASQTVTFTTAQDVAETYTINIDGLSGIFTVKAPPIVVPAKPINWPLISGIIAGVIIIGVIIWLVVRRQTA